MNNLKELKVKCSPHDIKGEIIYISVGADKKKEEIFCLREDCLVHVDLLTTKESKLLTEIYDVIRADYLIGDKKISIATKKSVHIVDCDTKNLYKKDFNEIQQIGWNNSGDCLVVIFKSGQLKTYIFDERCELIEHGKGEISALAPQQQSVGWGSKNTQFRGPPVADAENITAPHLKPTDNGKFVISWTGNGDEFIVSYIEDELRIFKVFDNLCVPKCCSELPLGKLYGPIAWKPQGNVIAAAMFKEDKNCIALFEKNGLYRMEFPLVDIFYPINFLSWSFCGRALIISHEDDKGNSHVCIYTTCNMMWFLKQHLVFYKKNSLIRLNWVPTDPQCLELLAVTSNLVIQYKYKFGFDTDSRSNMIAAINGKTIRIHGFSKSVDPSPSCTSIITHPRPINLIAFHPSKDLFAAIDSENNIYCYKVTGIDLNCTIQSSLTEQTFPLQVNHVFWKAEDPLFLIDNPSEYCSTMCMFEIESAELVKLQKFDVKQYAIEHIYAVGSIVVKHDAKYRTTHRVTETPVTSLNISYPLVVIPLKSDNDIFSLLLTPSQDLFFEDELVCRGITSIILCKDFLLLTDNTTLYTLKLNLQCLDRLAIDGLSEFHSRPLNELAYLICMLGDTSQIILHTPRGNLEIIACRSMEILNVEGMLSRGEWGAAIKLMRLARLNWNLLIDLNPDRFYANISKVVLESDPQHTLNAIVAEVNDENCLATVYKNTIDIIPYQTLNKRRDFLDKLSDYLDKNGLYVNYLSTVIRVCLDQNKIKKAMNYLSFLMNSSIETRQHKAEHALVQMKMQVEAMDLFKAALFTYNIQFADYVAQICQINPQEVGPILNELAKLNSFERRIAIQVRYQQWEMAVAYMINMDKRDKEAILQFIREHDVAKRAYIEALKIKNLEFMEDIAQLYVEKLIQTKHHNEAAIILVKYLLFDDAIEQFKLALEYKKCIEYIPLSNLSDADQRQFFNDLAEKLIVAQRVQDAAFIYETQLEDYITAVKILTKGKMFTEALRIAKDRCLNTMIDIYILPKISNFVKNIMEIVEETAEEFKNLINRLAKLRNIKKHEFELLMNRNSAGGALRESLAFRRKETDGLEKPSNLDSDVQSVISVGSGGSPPFFADSDLESNSTIRSQRSSRSNASSSTTVTQKQIRKMEKQKQDIAEGSKFEDIALMRKLHIIITQIFKFGPEVKEVFLRLIEYSIMDLEILRQHHKKLYELQLFMRDEVHNIWDEEFRSSITLNHINENYCYMDEIFRTIPPEVENPGLSWALELFKK